MSKIHIIRILDRNRVLDFKYAEHNLVSFTQTVPGVELGGD